MEENCHKNSKLNVSKKISIFYLSMGQVIDLKKTAEVSFTIEQNSVN